MWRRLGLLAVILAVLALPATADAKLIGQGDGTSFASASGVAKHPKKFLRVQVRTGSDPQSVDVSWSVNCQGRHFKFESRQGTFNVTTPAVRRLPRTVKRPTKCHVDVSASQTDFFVPAFLVQVFLLAK
jgi:hypothetical protein